MECNRDEALRAKEIAEKKYTENDIAGARKFALKAQALFPGLDGISQIIATLDVHAAAEVRINGEKDWYGILRLSPTADDEMIKKQFRKFALILHPDKNKSIGGDAAFQIISEAFNVLSDKLKRMVYDHKINPKVTQEKTSRGQGSARGFCHTAKTVATDLKTQQGFVPSAPSTAPPATSPPMPNTFWTLCYHCKMKYEYVRLYLNNTLLCPNCRHPFVATETENPIKGCNTFAHKGAQQTSNKQKKMASVPGMGSTTFQFEQSATSHHLNSQFGVFVNTANMPNACSSVNFSNQGPNITNLASDKAQKVCEEKIQTMSNEKLTKAHLPEQGGDDLASGSLHINPNSAASNDVKRSFPNKREMPVKRRKITRDDIMGHVREFTVQKKTGTVCSNSANKGLHSNGFKMETMKDVPGDSIKVKFGCGKASTLKMDITHLDLHNMLTMKAQKLVRMKLEIWRDAAVKLAAQQEKNKQKRKQKQSAVEKKKDLLEQDQHDTVKVEIPTLNIKHTDSGDMVTMHSSCGKSDKEEKDLVDAEEGDDTVAIDVPDPDFHDFDRDRSERAFENQQIWAVYDNEDGMPRFYALVQNVLSRRPFKIRMSYLVSRTNSEFGSLNWVGMGFAKVCGDFRIGKHETCSTINMFSHIVNPDRSQSGTIKILPKKGDIWALYKNWSPEWNEHTPDDVMYKYDMVEVLEDYAEEQTVSVIPLVKCVGFKTVFSRSSDPNSIVRIPKEEMFRFSHQVPCYILRGDEAQNAPSGCFELDPAATPLELLQVITEVKQEVPVKVSGHDASNRVPGEQIKG